MSFLLYSRIWMRSCIFRNAFLFSLNKLRDFLPCFIPTPASEYCISFSRDKRSDADRSRLSLLSFDAYNDGGNIGDKSEIVCENHLFIDDDAQENVFRKWERRWENAQSQTYLNADAFIVLKTSRKMTSRREQVTRICQ